MTMAASAVCAVAYRNTCSTVCDVDYGRRWSGKDLMEECVEVYWQVMILTERINMTLVLQRSAMFQESNSGLLTELYWPYAI